MLDRPQGIIIIQTPFRISFFGGGTDFPDFFNEYGGMVIGTAIDKYMYVTLNSLERFFEKRIRMSYSKLEFVDHPNELEHQIVKCVLNDHPLIDDKSFLDIHTYADLPSSSGVGSSSAFTVGMLNALYLLNGNYKTPEAIAKEAIIVEREKIKDIGGWQDQIFAAYGGFNCIRFANNQFQVEPICLSAQKKQALERSCMLFFTGDTRSSTAVQAQTMKADKNNYLDQLKQTQILTEQAFKELCAEQSAEELVNRFGTLLNQAWQLKRNFSNHITNDKIDEMYDIGLKAGALGGKLCGAGGGGFLLFIVPESKRASVLSALADYKYLEIKFEDRGSHVIYSKTYHSASAEKKLIK